MFGHKEGLRRFQRPGQGVFHFGRPTLVFYCYEDMERHAEPCTHSFCVWLRKRYGKQ